MSEPQQYTLRQPLIPTIYAFDGSVWAIEASNETILLKKTSFDELFVPVGSVDNLQQQIEALKQELYAKLEPGAVSVGGHVNKEPETETKIAINEVFDAVVSLIQGQHK